MDEPRVTDPDVRQKPVVRSLNDAEARLVATVAALATAEREAARRFLHGNQLRHPPARDLRQQRADLEGIVRGLHDLEIIERYRGLVAEIIREEAKLPALRDEFARLADPLLFKPPTSGWSTIYEFDELREAPHLALAAAEARITQLEDWISSLRTREQAMLREHASLLQGAADA